MNELGEPSIQRPNLIMTLLVGMIVGAMLAVVAVGGPEGQEVAGTGPASGAQTGAAGGTAGSTAPGAVTGAGAGGTATAPGGGAGGGGGGAGGGGSAADPGSAAPGEASSNGPDCSLLQTPGVRGVTDTTIRLGVGLADISALEPVLGEEAALGPQEAIFEAVLQGLRDEGLVPICGRDVELVFQRYQVLDEITPRAVCQSLINDHQVFAVLTSFLFRDPLCITQEHETFLLDHGIGASQHHFDQSGGRLFTLHPPVDVQYRIWTNWAIQRPLSAPGSRVGVYYNNADAEFAQLVERNVIDVFRAAGIEPVVHTSDTDGALALAGDPNNLGAVLRFKQEGVTHVMMVVGNFMEEAEQQDYHPTYLFYGANAKDSNSGRFVASQADGALGVHWDQSNDASRGVPPSPQAEQCIERAVRGGVARPQVEWAQWNLTLLACDELGLVIEGLRRAGSDITTERLAGGVRSISQWASYLVGRGGFADGRQWLVQENRETRWSASCACWQNTGEFEPLFYP